MVQLERKLAHFRARKPSSPAKTLLFVQVGSPMAWQSVLPTLLQAQHRKRAKWEPSFLIARSRVHGLYNRFGAEAALPTHEADPAASCFQSKAAVARLVLPVPRAREIGVGVLMIQSPCLLQLSLRTRHIWPQKQAGLLHSSPIRGSLTQPLPQPLRGCQQPPRIKPAETPPFCHPRSANLPPCS